MPARNILIDLLYDGELDNIPTVSGEDRPFQVCSECAAIEGRHHFFCSFNRDLWNEETEIEIEREPYLKEVRHVKQTPKGSGCSSSV